MNEHHTPKPRMPGIKNFPFLGPVGVMLSSCTMRHVHTYHCTKMRRYRALSKPLVASSVCRSWADCIINIAGFDLRQAQAGPLNNAPIMTLLRA